MAIGSVFRISMKFHRSGYFFHKKSCQGKKKVKLTFFVRVLVFLLLDITIEAERYHWSGKSVKEKPYCTASGEET